MPDFLKAPFADGPTVAPLDVLVRLLLALAFGFFIAWVHRRTRRGVEVSPSFMRTLVLLCVLIALVIQVIGDSVARAFSLVGALSIVRFRTVLRDTQDTAYVIFAVVVGMAVGARNPLVGAIGVAVVTLAAFLLMIGAGTIAKPQTEFLLRVRAGLGHDLDKLLAPPCETHLEERELISVATARQGTSLEAMYRTRLRPGSSADEFVRALNTTDGIQEVELQRRGFVDD